MTLNPYKWWLRRKIKNDPRFYSLPKGFYEKSISELEALIHDRDVYMNHCVPMINAVENLIKQTRKDGRIK